MNFSTNQVRQVYVLDAAPTKKTLDSGYFYYVVDAAKGINTDIIEGTDAVMYTTTTLSNALKPKVRTYTVVLNANVNGGAPVPGQEYILTLFYRNFVGSGEVHQKRVKGYVKAKTGMTATQFYTALADSIKLNIKNDVNNLVTVASSATGVTLTETVSDWVLGQSDINRVLKFDLYSNAVTYSGDEYQGLTFTYTEAVDSTYPSGRVAADLEYFAHGERGDQYRNYGWPFVIKTDYEVDPTAEYNIVTIHFAHNAVSSNKASEKDIQFIIKASAGTPSVAADGTITVA